MISEIKNVDINLLNKLKQNHYTRRIKSHFLAYGNEYDFCRFFNIKIDGNFVGIISCFYSSMIISSAGSNEFTEETLDEIADFILLNKPMSVELESRYSNYLLNKTQSEYSSDVRTEFEFVPKNIPLTMTVDELPKLNDVFEVLRKCFSAISADDNQLWLADTSHRVRRGLSQSFLLDNCTTATIQYIIDGTVLIGNVATLPEERGKFHARYLLYWIGEKLTDDGFNVRLMARPNRVSYYEEIGFKAIGTDIVLERKI